MLSYYIYILTLGYLVRIEVFKKFLEVNLLKLKYSDF